MTSEQSVAAGTPLTPTITASTNNISRDSLDCGLKAIGWCKGEKCQRLARLRYFLPIFLLIGILHGASETYFRISTKQTTLYHNNYDPQIIDWLLVSTYIFQALLAFIIGFWSQHFHPMSWLGGLTIFQSVFCFLSVIPTLTHFDFDVTSSKYENFTSLCKNLTTNFNLQEERPDHEMKLIMLFLLQFGIALGYTAFYTIGLSYIDDNANIEDTPTIFGAAIAFHIWGSLFGSIITFIADIQYLNWWFGWIIIGPILLIIGTLITLFPRKLLRVVLKQAAQRIINGTSVLNPISRSRQFQFIDDINFLPSLRRLLTNKILLLNLFGLAFYKTGIYNYNLNEQNYLQSRFYFPTDENNGIMDEWLSRFLSYLLKPPIIGTTILLTGFIISRLKPSARFLSVLNIISGSLTAIIFISFVFIDCSGTESLAGVYKGIVTQPFCSKECICSTADTLFLPVCPEKSNLTYFSPCHAGCKTKVILNDITIYENCTCNSNPEYVTDSVRATLGACNIKECQAKWIVFQILIVIVAALFGTMLVSKILITLRSVLDQDKSLALALDLFVCGIIVYLPGKLIYDTVTKNTCQFWSLNYKKCLLQDSPLYGNILNLITFAFVVIGIIFDVFVYIFTDDLDIFSRNPAPYDDEPFHFTPPLLNVPQRSTSTAVVRNGDNNNNNNGSRERNTIETRPLLQATSGSTKRQQDKIQPQTEQIQQQQQQENVQEQPQRLQQQEQQQHQSELDQPHLQELQKKLQRRQEIRQNPPRPISPSSSSDAGTTSPEISPYRRQGAIPKILMKSQQQPAVETSF